MGVSSEQSYRNMNRLLVTCAFVACAYGAPMPEADADYAHGLVAAAPVATVAAAPAAVGYAGAAVGYAGGAVVGAPVAHAPAVVGQTHHSYAAGPPTVENHVEYGVVGHQTVQTGVQQVVAGHAYAVAGHESIPQPAVSYAAGAPQNLVQTVPIAPPAIPVAPLPPAPIPAGPAPADTVVQQRILAPVRTHTRITPQVTNIVPQINVQKYNVDVPIAVPRAVPREIIVTKEVPRPYEVAVPRAVPVPAPYKVHPVQEIVETPHIHRATVETHSSQAVVTAHATPVHAVSHVPVASAAPVAAVAAAPAVAAVGYAGYAGHAVAAPAVGYAGYAGHAVAAPAVGYGGRAIAAPAVVA